MEDLKKSLNITYMLEDGHPNILAHQLLELCIKNNTPFYEYGSGELNADISYKESKKFIEENIEDCFLAREFKNRNSELLNATFMGKNTIAFIRYNYSVLGWPLAQARAYSRSKEELDAFQKFFDKHIFIKRIKKEKGPIYSLINTPNGPRFQYTGTAGSPLVKENYSSEVVEKYENILYQFSSKNPDGRISILTGEPGTGKSYMLRALLTEAKNSAIVLLAPEYLSQLSGPSLLPALLDFKRDVGDRDSIVFVVEDADSCLAPRAADNMNAITSILNLSDGIFGAMLNIQIVTTTNARREEFDEAVSRPGRLCEIIQFGPLDFDHALRIAKRLGLTKEDIEHKNEWTLAELYKVVKMKKNPILKDKKQKPKAKASIGF